MVIELYLDLLMTFLLAFLRFSLYLVTLKHIAKIKHSFTLFRMSYWLDTLLITPSNTSFKQKVHLTVSLMS